MFKKCRKKLLPPRQMQTHNFTTICDYVVVQLLNIQTHNLEIK